MRKQQFVRDFHPHFEMLCSDAAYFPQVFLTIPMLKLSWLMLKKRQTVTNGWARLCNILFWQKLKKGKS